MQTNRVCHHPSIFSCEVTLPSAALEKRCDSTEASHKASGDSATLLVAEFRQQLLEHQAEQSEASTATAQRLTMVGLHFFPHFSRFEFSRLIMRLPRVSEKALMVWSEILKSDPKNNSVHFWNKNRKFSCLNTASSCLTPSRNSKTAIICNFSETCFHGHNRLGKLISIPSSVASNQVCCYCSRLDEKS